MAGFILNTSSHLQVYILFYRLQMESVNKPKREVKQLTGPVQSYKPVSDHYHNVSYTSQRMRFWYLS